MSNIFERHPALVQFKFLIVLWYFSEGLKLRPSALGDTEPVSVDYPSPRCGSLVNGGVTSEQLPANTANGGPYLHKPE